MVQALLHSGAARPEFQLKLLRAAMGTQISFSLHPSSGKHSTAHNTYLMQNSRTQMKYEMLMSTHYTDCFLG